jgi:hypothetical protein
LKEDSDALKSPILPATPVLPTGDGFQIAAPAAGFGDHVQDLDKYLRESPLSCARTAKAGLKLREEGVQLHR